MDKEKLQQGLNEYEAKVAKAAINFPYRPNLTTIGRPHFSQIKSVWSSFSAFFKAQDRTALAKQVRAL